MPSGGGNVTTSTGQTVDVNDNGKSGSTIDLPSPPTTGGVNPNKITVNLPGTGGVTVASGDKGSQVSVQKVTTGGKTTSTLTVTQGRATATATAFGQALIGIQDAGIVVVSQEKGTSATMTVTGGNAHLGVTGGSKITVEPGAKVSGTTIDLAAGSNGNKNVTVEVGGQTLQVQVGSTFTQVSFTKVDIGGVMTPVLTVTGGGSVTVTAQGNGAMLSVGNGANNTLVNSSGDSACPTSVDAQTSGGQTRVHVASCSMVLPANAFAGQGFAAVKDRTVLVNETAEFNAAGKVTRVRLGTLNGDTAAAGDKRGRAGTANLEYRTWVPLLDAVPTRFGAAPKLNDAIVALVNKDAPGLTYRGTQADGSLRFSSADGRMISALPVGTVEVDTSQPDGITLDSHGKVKVATQGLFTRFSATATDLPAFADRLRAICPSCKTIQIEDGNLHVSGGNITYVGVADWYADASQGAGGFGNDADGTASYTGAGQRHRPSTPPSATWKRYWRPARRSTQPPRRKPRATAAWC